MTTCSHCTLAEAANKVPRELALTTNRPKTNVVIHFSNLHIDESYCDHEYVLVVNWYISCYVWLETTKLANAATTAISVVSWLRVIKGPQFLISDYKLLFINLIVQRMVRFFDI